MRGPNPQSKFKSIGKVGIKTTGFGDKTRQEDFHLGIDLASSSGTPIKTPVSGVVTKVDMGHADGSNDFGNTVEIRDAQGNSHQFHHLQGATVAQGQNVAEGQPIMTTGKSGAVYSPTGGDPSSLDYRIVDRFARFKDPSKYISKL